MRTFLIFSITFSLLLLVAKVDAQYKPPTQPQYGQQGYAGPTCCTFYVSQSTGNDSNAGTIALPWQTISKVNGTTLTAGQSVGLKAGDTWRETLTPSQSGANGSPITFTAYGVGAAPLIAASNAPTFTIGGGQAAQESCTGSCLFASGFETAAFADWTGTTHGGSTTISIDTGNFAHGVGSMKIVGNNSNNAFATKTITALASASTYYMRAYFYTPTGSLNVSTSNDVLWVATTGTIKNFVQLKTNSGGAVTLLTIGGAANICANTSITWPMDTWNRIDWSLTPHSTTTLGATQLWINGVSVCNASAVNTSSSVGANQLDIGSFNAWVNGGALNFDDVQFASAAINCFSAGVPAGVYTTAQATDPLYPINVTGGIPLTKVTNTRPSCFDSLTFPSVATGQYFWDGSATLYVYNPSGTNTIEIPARANGITISGKHDISISNLAVRGGTQGNISTSGDFSRLSVSGVTSSLSYQQGLSFNEASASVSNVSVSNSNFTYNGASGLDNVVYNQSGFKFSGIYADHNAQIYKLSSPWQFTSGIHNFCNGVGSGPAISASTSSNNGLPPLTGTNDLSGTGMHLDTCNSASITASVAFANNGAGIMAEKNNNSTISYNVAYNNRPSGCADPASDCSAGNFLLRTGEGIGSDSVVFAQNTGFGGQISALCFNDGDSTSKITNSAWTNNIFTGGATFNLYVSKGCNNDTTNGSGNALTYENLGTDSVATLAFVTTTGAISTYAALQSALLYTTHNTAGDPLFVNSGAANFTLQGGSPAIGAGIFIAGVSTANPPNIGAK